MKKILLFLALLMGLSVMVVGNAQAALIGVNLTLPDILSDSVGTYSYNATTNLFTATATPVTITFDGTTLINIIGSRSYLASFYVNESGNFTGGVGGADLTIKGTIDANGNGLIDVGELSGILVSGEITNFGWQDLPPTTLDAFDYAFNVTGGLLASYYGTTAVGGDVMTSEVSTFSGSFLSGFSGTKAKHNTAPVVPEPGSMLLLGMGILGIFGLKRRKVI